MVECGNKKIRYVEYETGYVFYQELPCNLM